MTDNYDYLPELDPEDESKKAVRFRIDNSGKDEEYPANRPSQVTGRIVLNGDFLEIFVDRYGENSMEDGYGPIVSLEYHDRELRLVYSPDINDQEPVIVSLEGALESKRAGD